MDEYKEVPTRANDEENANFLSKMFFTYLLPFLRVGYKRALKKQDFCQVAKNDESEYLADILERNWEDELEKRTKNNVPPDLHKAISKTFAGPFWFYSAFFFYQRFGGGSID
uniref:Uncharacterized protein n=1 Tax=Romanomermis culicivorax TaxID=13658 RepID=A0A915JRH0_ROMCU